MRVDAGGDDVCEDFFTGLENDSRGAAVLDEDFADGCFGADFDAGFAGGVCDGVRNGASAAATEAPGAERAIDFAHVVVKENVSGAGRTNAEERADDARSGHGGFEDIGLEPLVEKVRGAHGHELDEGVALVGRKFAKALQQEVELLEVFGIERGGIGRNHGEHGLHEAAHRRHHLREFVVGFGVETRMAADVADGFRVIVHAPEVVAAGHGGKGAVKRKNLEAVARKIEFADDFGAKERDNVRTFGEKKAGDDFFGDGGAAEHVATFEDDDLLPSFGEVGGVDQAVVAAADDDDVVVLTHSL